MPGALEALENLRSLRSELRSVGGFASPGLLETLSQFIAHEQDPYVRRDAVRALGGIADARILDVLANLTRTEESSSVLTSAVMAIAEYGGAPAGNLLLEFIGRRARPTDRWLRQVASNSLVRLVLGGEEPLRNVLLPRLRNMVGSPNSFERMNATAILGTVGDRAALPMLVKQRERELASRVPEAQYVLRELDATISHLEKLR